MNDLSKLVRESIDKFYPTAEEIVKRMEQIDIDKDKISKLN